ncbi:unnamed protein product [Didymodactylos carnosus]|uniref:MATH domain-containing protein n=1 Tax=Didymodactylos carnosus TaxID=1234261 RepID=A0A815GVJ2_9BILA|nr:unnamed protein product [Didymodactylos carnosus]CAF1343534.1 unnamed protein product [Didymodactylos carnosus]CAF3799773.1 unnamed protein product [Didymodactylos carnosus]CAF4207198.1 unnamed protein product [Didymodactylos carnosus]
MVNQTLNLLTFATTDEVTTCECSSCDIKMQKEHRLHEIKCSRSNNQFEDDQLLQTYEMVNDCIVEKQCGAPELQKLTRCVSADLGCCKESPEGELHKRCSSELHQKCITGSIHHYTTMRPLDNDSDTEMALKSTAISSTDIRYLCEEHNRLYETLTTLTSGMETLMCDKTWVTTELFNLKSLVDSYHQEQLKLKQSEQEQDAIIRGIQLNEQILQQNLTDLTQNAENMQSTSYDGTFIWKIKKVAQAMVCAQSEQQSSIYSPSFYSSQTGYKMCIRAYLNGDGNARGTHLSLFFVLMRGEYDAILTWPFHFKVTFCMLDQSGEQRHIIDSFRPDVKSNSFQIPKTQMNIASGIPKFFPLSILQQDGNNYVKDDTLFIKCIVDFNLLPKMLLPYFLSLNPGLPSNVQNEMIKSETKRRQENQQQTSTHT